MTRQSYVDLPLDAKCSCGCGENVALRKSNDGVRTIVQSNLSRRCMAIKQRYGMTYNERQQMWEAQDCKCLLCRREIDWFAGSTQKGQRSTRAAVDHCHATGKVRGILCVSCNLALGSVQDDPETLRRMHLYVLGTDLG